MEIRRLGPADATDYRVLRLRALREEPTAFTSSDTEEGAKPLDWYAQRLGSAVFFAAFDEGTLCGMVGLEREQRIKNRHKGHVVGMYVAPEHGGKGIGRALLDAIVADARTQGIEMLVLTVTQGNARAIDLYERAGFRSFGIEPRSIRVDGRDYGKNHMYRDIP